MMIRILALSLIKDVGINENSDFISTLSLYKIESSQP